MADVIPKRVRGRYMAFRQFAVIPVALAVMVIVGLILDLAERAESVTVLTITSCMIMVAGLLGVLDIQCFTRMPDENPPRPSRQTQWLKKLREPLRDRNFMRFLAFQFTFILAIGFIGQYVWLFVLEQAQVPKLTANVMLLGVPLVISGFAATFWGKLVDRLGHRPVLIISGIFIVAGPFGWFIVTPEAWIWGYLLTCVSPFAFAGVNLASFNTVLAVSKSPRSDYDGPVCRDCGFDLRGTPESQPCPECGSTRSVAPRHETGRGGGSAYIAMHSLAMALGGILSGVLGAFVAKVAIDFQWHIPSLGMQLTYHHLLFVISSSIRVVAVIWALTIQEAGSAPVPIAMRIAGAELWSNVRRSVTFPARAAVRVRQWTNNSLNSRNAA
jgi:MFS family permease